MLYCSRKLSRSHKLSVFQKHQITALATLWMTTSSTSTFTTCPMLQSWWCTLMPNTFPESLVSQILDKRCGKYRIHSSYFRWQQGQWSWELVLCTVQRGQLHWPVQPTGEGTGQLHQDDPAGGHQPSGQLWLHARGDVTDTVFLIQRHISTSK